MKKVLIFLLLISSSPLPLIAMGGEEDSGVDTSFEHWEDVRSRLTGLSFDHFLEASYRELSIRTPELVTELGLDDAYALEGSQLNNMSEAYISETERIQQGVYDLFKDYPDSALSAGQRESRDIAMWYLEDLIKLQEYRFQSFTVNHFPIAEPGSTELFFSDVQPVRTLIEAENYLIRMEQVGTKMEQLADGIQLRQEAGVLLPSLSIRWSLGKIYVISQSLPDNNLYYLTFKQKLSQLELAPEKQEELLVRALAASEDSVIPGYKTLGKVLSSQSSISGNNIGAWSLPDGEDYYKAVLSHHTTTDFTPKEIHERGLKELERIHKEMRLSFAELGIDTRQPISEMYAELDRMAEQVSAYDAVAVFSGILEQAKTLSAPFFNKAPIADVIVKGAEVGGFYMPASIDGSRPGIFFAAESSWERYKMPTLTFHETIPGHHFQLALANELPISPYQKGSSFLGYVEGWALYSERLMAESGYYKDDPAGNLGRLQAEAYRAARLVVDTGLHHYKWDFDKAIHFFVENTGFSKGYGTWEVLRYIVWPGQAAAYMTGLLKILDLREEYKAASGDGYDPRGFHSLVLEQGAAPLSLLEKRLREDF